MPGLYLAAILLSWAGVAALDFRYRLAFQRNPRAVLVAVVLGTAFFLLWDAAGISLGIFVKGSGPALLGVDLAPHLPAEEPVFLAFFCYLSLVVFAAAARLTQRRIVKKEADGTS